MSWDQPKEQEMDAMQMMAQQMLAATKPARDAQRAMGAASQVQQMAQQMQKMVEPLRVAMRTVRVRVRQIKRRVREVRPRARARAGASSSSSSADPGGDGDPHDEPPVGPRRLAISRAFLVPAKSVVA